VPHMAETQPSSWRERALAVCMAAHDRLGASCPQAVRSVASSPDLVCAIMWHVFPYGAPLVVKVQYVCHSLNIELDQTLVEAVAHATDKLKLTSAFDGMPVELKVDACLDMLLDRTSNARPPSTPDLLSLKAKVQAEMVAKSEAAWSLMRATRKADATAHSAAAVPHVVRSEGSAESIRRWLREHCVRFPEDAMLADLQALAAEERAALAEEAAAMAEFNASMATRGQPTVVSAISTSGASRTVLDEARAGEELARREQMEAAREADALAAMPVAIGSPASVEGQGLTVVVVAEAVSVDEKRPKGGIAALMNTMRIS